MNMQEFSHRLRREEHPSPQSQLFRALRSLSDFDLDRLRDLGRTVKADWGIWTDFEPGVHAERAEPRS